MVTYTLLLAIDDAVLRRHGVPSRLVLAKSAGNAPPNVTWLAFSPAARTAVRWSETYGLYAADVPPAHNTALRIRDSVYPAADRHVYPFRDAAFDPPVAAPRVPRRHYDVHNSTAAAATFGLLQEAMIDGKVLRSPVNAVTLPPDATADFTTIAKLYIWAQNADAGEGVGPEIPGNATIVPLDPRCPEMTYRFDGHSSTFVSATAKGTP